MAFVALTVIRTRIRESLATVRSLSMYSDCLTDASMFELRQFVSKAAEFAVLEEDRTEKIRALIRMPGDF